MKEIPMFYSNNKASSYSSKSVNNENDPTLHNRLFGNNHGNLINNIMKPSSDEVTVPMKPKPAEVFQPLSQQQHNPVERSATPTLTPQSISTQQSNLINLENLHIHTNIANSIASSKPSSSSTMYDNSSNYPTSSKSKPAISSSAAVNTPLNFQSSAPATVAVPPPSSSIASKIGTVEKIHKMLDQSCASSTNHLISSNNIVSPSGTAMVCSPSSSSSSARSNLWVVRYIDYTSKYGLGFLFNNGSAGVYFNDSTKIVLSADGKYFQYIERRKESTASFGSEHLTQKFYIDTYPVELQKKVTLLKHFKNYLLEEEAKNPRNMNHGEQNVNELQALKTAFSKEYTSEKTTTNTAFSSVTNKSMVDLEDDPELPFLKKWVKTKHAILFRISNRTVQVIFYDRR
jgi:ribosomal protein L9